MQDRKANILYTSSFGSLQGGGQRSLFLLLKYLDLNKFTPYLAVPDSRELAQEAVKLKVKTLILPFPRVSSLNLFSTITCLIKLRKIIREYNIDIIHTDNLRDAFYAALMGKHFNTRIILHARVREHFRWLDRLIYHFTDSIIAVSQSVANRFKRMDKKNKVKVVYNGVELDIFKPDASLKGKRDKFIIGYFGRINRKKGVEYIIKAIANIRKNIELIIMGDGDMRYLEELKMIADKDSVFFKEYERDIVKEIAKVDAVVLPSLIEEGLPRIFIESLAMGKIVIASDLSPYEEILGDLPGFIFRAGDDKALSAIIEKIMADKNILYETERAYRLRAESFFDIKKKTQEIEGIYSSLLGTKHGNRRWIN